MTNSVDQRSQLAAVLTALTGPGGRFESAVEDVLGTPMPVLVNRGRALGDVLAASLQHGDQAYLITDDRRLSFAEHGAAVAALAAALREQYRIGKGDRVAILAANTAEWVVAFWAAQALGAIAVGFNAWWAPREIEYAIAHTAPAVLIADAKRAALLDGLDVVAPVLTMERDLPRLIADFAGAALPRVAVDEDDPAVILYTSGTSGRPKGAVHSHRNLLAVIDYHRYSDALAAAFTGGGPTDGPAGRRYLLTSPLFHIASLHNLVVPRLATGDAVVIHQGSFDPDRVLGLIERERVTNWGAVPTLANRLLDHDSLDRYDLSSLTSLALASAPSSPAFQQRLRDRLPFASGTLVDSYGLTECSTAVSVATPQDLHAFPGTLGRPIIGVSVEIRDPLGEPVPDGVEGEICVRSPYVMLGYWADEAATTAAITADRWLRTGDFGMLENGMVRLTGRRSDLILRGGENVYPVEIEQCLDEHPAIAECAVVGVEHPDLGQEVAAVVVVRPDQQVTAAQLHEFTAERLAYFKVPSRWRITDSALPRNATGKVLRTRIPIDPTEWSSQQ